MIGVYFIKNKINGKFYVGHSIDIKYRFRRHLYELKRNIHHCQYLQRAWNKYGEDNFEFIIYKECSTEEESQDLEQYFIDNYKDVIYNVSNNARLGGDLLTDNPNRDEIIKKITSAVKERYINMTKEEKVLKYGKFGEKNPMYDKKRPKEIIDKLVQSRKNHSNYIENKTYEEYFGKEKAAEIRKRMIDNRRSYKGENNPFYGKTHTEETLKYLREINLGKKPTNMKKVIINDVIYESVTEASRQLNVCPATIIYRIKSKSKQYLNYNYLEE